MNTHFWKNKKEIVSVSAVDEKVANYQTEVGVTKYLALAIEKRAKELESTFPKRTHDSLEVYDKDEDSDSSVSSGEYRSRSSKKQKMNKKKTVKPIARTVALQDSNAKVQSYFLYALFDETFINTILPLNGCLRSGLFEESIGLKKILQICVSSEKRMKKGSNVPDFRELLGTTPTTKLSLRESKRATSQWMVEAWNNEDDDLLVFGDILHQTQVFNHHILELELIQFIPVMVMPRLLSGTSSKTGEDTFVYNAVSDLLNVVFGEDQRLVHEW
ncbi:hypothetical protein INT45_013348 [Circinella minor]|uniref:Uncharacterized protein n=1 Tax=Circinella minor TaxID=1195481 RepID=A0A8H7RYU1_9FUNG|nr:hypothetical protein INT45_013348 [Circinella minor]